MDAVTQVQQWAFVMSKRGAHHVEPHVAWKELGLCALPMKKEEYVALLDRSDSESPIDEGKNTRASDVHCSY